MPLPSDPHEVYVAVFEGMLKDPYWQQNAPEPHKELLWQRMMLQNTLLQQQQAQMMAMQQAAQPKGSAPAEKGKRTPENAGEAQQNAQGPQGKAGAVAGANS
jgi:hypothetical protein